MVQKWVMIQSSINSLLTLSAYKSNNELLIWYVQPVFFTICFAHTDPLCLEIVSFIFSRAFCVSFCFCVKCLAWCVLLSIRLIFSSDYKQKSFKWIMKKKEFQLIDWPLVENTFLTSGFLRSPSIWNICSTGRFVFFFHPIRFCTSLPPSTVVV